MRTAFGHAARLNRSAPPGFVSRRWRRARLPVEECRSDAGAIGVVKGPEPVQSGTVPKWDFSMGQYKRSGMKSSKLHDDFRS